MQVDNNNNFCRVFELPNEYPEGFCFGGGYPIPFQMVDWFNPIPSDDINQKELKAWEIYEQMLLDFVIKKQYVHPDKEYLLITDFGKAFMFKKGD